MSLTTREAAERLGITRQRVAALIRAARLKAEKKGRDWLIEEQDLLAVTDRKPGRPKQEE